MVAPTNKNTIEKTPKEKIRNNYKSVQGHISDAISKIMSCQIISHRHSPVISTFKVPNSSSGYSLDPPWTIFSAFCFHPTRNFINSYPNLFSVPSSVCSAQHHFLNHHSPRFHAHPKCPFSARNPLLPSR